MSFSLVFSSKFARTGADYCKNNTDKDYGSFLQKQRTVAQGIRKVKREQQWKAKRGMVSSNTHVDIQRDVFSLVNASADEPFLDATTNVIYSLSVEGDDEAATRAVVQGNALPMLASALLSENQSIVHLSTWALVNVTATSFTKEVANTSGIIQSLVRNLSNNSHPDIQEMSAWCLANMAGDGVELRDAVLSAGVLDPL